MANAQLIVAHSEGLGHTAGEVALAAIMVAALLIPLIALAVVARIFYRAAKRDAEAEARRRRRTAG